MTASLLALAVVLSLGALLWMGSLAIENSSIIDLAWGPLFFAIAAVEHSARRGDPGRCTLVLLLVGAWACRLALHLFVRNGFKHEDRRYAAMRARHGKRWAMVSLSVVFLLQPVLAWVVSLPVQAVMLRPGTPPVGWVDGLAALLVVVGTVVETTADVQLARFRSSGDSGVLDAGLWRYSRHPNYFGDFIVWWGFGAFGVAAGSPWTIVGPLLMSYLLLRVSGVTLLEKTIVSRRPDYATYQQRTNAFFPGRPKRARPEPSNG